MMLKVAKLGIAIAAVLAWIVPAAYAGVPDVALSFYVPQGGSVGTPTEGAAALQFFRVCPNNDAVSVAAHARIKVVVRDVNGNGIANIAAADICILFNGGTTIQGFSGVGADSVIANQRWAPVAQCPDVRCVQADAPTDANGTTFITFLGANALNPGVGVRDPLRKWGHYDSELPVFVLGFKLSGRLTTASANGTYTLRVKNFDISQPSGLLNQLNLSEVVNQQDVNQFAPNFGNLPGNIQKYWCDFNNDNLVNQTDVNAMAPHVGHDCDSALP